MSLLISINSMIEEENPMLGFRGASRHYHKSYKESFALEYAAVLKMRSHMGLTNVVVMLPFVRTPEEGQKGSRSYGRTRPCAGPKRFIDLYDGRNSKQILS